MSAHAHLANNCGHAYRCANETTGIQYHECPEARRDYCMATLCNSFEKRQPRQRHTPGPWIIEKTSRFGSPADGRVAASIRTKQWERSDQMGDYRGAIICDFEAAHGERYHAFEETDANARLIAAAPELLDACHMFCRTLAFTPSSVPGAIEADLKTAYDKARLAIEKAEGGQ